MDLEQDKKEKYRWPWFLLGALILAAILAILWMTAAVRQVREQRDTNPFAAPPSAVSNSAK